MYSLVMEIQNDDSMTETTTKFEEKAESSNDNC